MSLLISVLTGKIRAKISHLPPAPRLYLLFYLVSLMSRAKLISK